MKVVKVIHEIPFVWRFDCKHCGSTLEAEAADVQWALFGAYCETGTKEYFVVCPVCDGDNFVPSEKLTKKLKASARKWRR